MNLFILSLLIQRQFKEQRRMYGISLLVLFGMLSLMFLLIHQWQDSFSGAVQNGVFIIGLFVSGGIFTNSMFHEFSNSSSSIWLLSLPAKQSEKVIVSIFISTVLFMINYLTIFYLVESIYLLNTKGLELKNMLNPIKDDFYIFFFLYLLFNSAILLGRVVFIKHSLLKTLLVGILLFVCLNYLNNVILEILIPNMNVVSSIPFSSFQFVNNGENIHVFLPTHTDRITSIFVRLLLPITLWFLVWMKLKEKQI
ncbi:MAG: hypothetical protein P1U56_24745 [Saprospiraceae bacterium]|nr:hypothetical protein [Saprospiraceae bacterium]